MNNLDDRDIRQRDLIPPEKLSQTDVTIVGVGAIGRQVALQLAAIGVPKIKLIDFDSVEVENLAAQGFFETDLGKSKVSAVSGLCKQINSKISVPTVNRKFSNLSFTGGVIFCCVDSIDTRKEIFQQVRSRADLWIDGRMSAEYLRVLSVYNDETGDWYEENEIFPSSESFQGSCTAKTTIYCSNIAAGVMVAQFAKWLRGCEIDRLVELNTLTNEMRARS